MLLYYYYKLYLFCIMENMSCHVTSQGFFTLVEPFKLHRFRLRDIQGEEAGIVLCVVDVVGATHTKSTHETPGEVFLEDHPI